MPRNGSHPPRGNPRNTDWEYTNHQDAWDFGRNQITAASHWPSPTEQASVPRYQPLDQMAHLLADSPFPHHSAYAQMVRQSQSPPGVADVSNLPRAIGDGASNTPDDSLAGFPSYHNATALPWDRFPSPFSPVEERLEWWNDEPLYHQPSSSLSLLQDGYSGRAVEELGDQHAALTSAASRMNTAPPLPSLPESNSWKCLTCSKSFSSQGGLNRHIIHSAQHRESSGTALHRCRCGFKQTRRDNYRRHVNTCKKTITTLYRCNCGEESSDPVEHRGHIEVCNLIRRSE
ncbi:hypothetical protein ANO14919_088490 [Xylariales sp. No.14919]|nr:hypothetical protein ANO14919_088490 [Xylariales sp. No.14919]